MKDTHDLTKDRSKDEKSSDSEIEQVLAYMGVYPDEVGKKIAYRHWYKFIELTKKMDGQP